MISIWKYSKYAAKFHAPSALDIQKQTIYLVKSPKLSKFRAPSARKRYTMTAAALTNHVPTARRRRAKKSRHFGLIYQCILTQFLKHCPKRIHDENLRHDCRKFWKLRHWKWAKRAPKFSHLVKIPPLDKMSRMVGGGYFIEELHW